MEEEEQKSQKKKEGTWRFEGEKRTDMESSKKMGETGNFTKKRRGESVNLGNTGGKNGYESE